MDNPRHPHQFWFALRILDELELRYLASREVPEAWVQFSDLQSLQVEARDVYDLNFTDDETRLAGEEAIQLFYEDNPEALDIWSNASTRRTSRESVTDIVDDIVDIVTEDLTGIVTASL
jgi:hypothetical protein